MYRDQHEYPTWELDSPKEPLDPCPLIIQLSTYFTVPTHFLPLTCGMIGIIELSLPLMITLRHISIILHLRTREPGFLIGVCVRKVCRWHSRHLCACSSPSLFVSAFYASYVEDWPRDQIWDWTVYLVEVEQLECWMGVLEAGLQRSWCFVWGNEWFGNEWLVTDLWNVVIDVVFGQVEVTEGQLLLYTPSEQWVDAPDQVS